MARLGFFVAIGAFVSQTPESFNLELISDRPDYVLRCILQAERDLIIDRFVTGNWDATSGAEEAAEDGADGGYDDGGFEVGYTEIYLRARLHALGPRYVHLHASVITRIVFFLRSADAVLDARADECLRTRNDAQ
eukprot:6182151-Pleurochrysis_carterae.AAC.1